MDDVTLAYAKEHLDELIERARRGEAVAIVDARLGTVRRTAVRVADRAVPRLTDTTPFVPLKAPRVPGRWKDRLPEPPPGFFDPLSDEELKDWYGDDE